MTTISDLPNDLVGEILSRVPITCLGAVRSTCKRWKALSEERILCKTEAKHQFLGFMMKKYKLCSLRFDLHGTFNEEEFVDPSVKEIDNKLLNQINISKVYQCDGLLLCVTKEDNARLVVWNPYLCQTRWIQPRRAYHGQDCYAIGYDNNRKHKILRFLDCYDHSVKHTFAEYEIYDFSSSSWRVLDITPTCEIQVYQRGTCLKGNTYFFGQEKIVYQEDGEYPEPPENLICFDFTKESFGEFLPLPFLLYMFYDVGAFSCIGNEKLAALSHPEDISKVEIWVTSMIEPNAVSWNPFLVVDMSLRYGFYFRFSYGGGSFFIDEEKKVAVVIDYDASEMTRYEDEAYIIGENGSYVPTLAHIN
ncbi:putative F-box protein At3g20030 [Capsella rubella]|uniref:putative F-box protein At3g20030 n=1 Tax=Capsella rubella TaxID=81985 RepID=UPI000CD54910|nr:putative F-box protein At3g20030 [Capsella rubella]